MKKWFFGEKKHIDQQKIADRKDARQDIYWLQRYGTEQEMEDYLRALNPKATNEQIARALAEYRADHQKQMRDGGGHSA